MAKPTFDLPTSGADPKTTSKSVLDAEVNRVLTATYEDIDSKAPSTALAEKLDVSDWQHQFSGLFLVDPHYELSGNQMYIKPGTVSGKSAYIRGGYLPDNAWTYTEIKDDLGAMSAPSTSQIGVTSPLGVTDCILLQSNCTIYYNPATQSWGWGVRAPSRTGMVKVIENDLGEQVGHSTEFPEIVRKLSRHRIAETRVDSLVSIMGSLTGEIPDLNTETQIFTIPYDVILKAGNYQKAIPAEVEIDLSAVVSSAKCVYYDTATDTFTVREWNAALNNVERQKFLFVAFIRYRSTGWTVSINCPYTINGRPPLSEGVFLDNRYGAAIEGIHHRGFSDVAPENTLAAYRASAAAKNYCVEGDVRFSSDDVPVLIHDETVDRTTNGTGSVGAKTLAELNALDAGSWKDAKFAGEPVPSLLSVLRLCKKLDLFIYLEIKTLASVPQIQSIIDDIRSSGMQGRVELHSFHMVQLERVVAADPTQNVGLLGDINSTNIADAVTLKTASNSVTMAANFSSLTGPFVDDARDNGLRVVTWTVDTSANAITAANLGVDGIITNKLNIAQVLREANL